MFDFRADHGISSLGKKEECQSSQKSNECKVGWFESFHGTHRCHMTSIKVMGSRKSRHRQRLCGLNNVCKSEKWDPYFPLTSAAMVEWSHKQKNKKKIHSLKTVDAMNLYKIRAWCWHRTILYFTLVTGF